MNSGVSKKEVFRMRFKLPKLFCLFIVVLMASACLDLEPDSSINILGDPHTVTLSVDDLGEGEIVEFIEGQPVVFRVIEGPNTGRESIPFSGECIPDSCRLDENLQVSWTYTSQEIGLDYIAAYLQIGIEDILEEIPSDVVTKRWEFGPRPIPTLSEWGLIAMAGVMGVIAFIVLRKKKSAA